MRLLLALTALSLAAGAATSKQPPLSPEAQHILDLATSAPPEFHAWAIFRLLDGGKVKDRASQRQLLDDAYQLGASAQARYPVQTLSGTPREAHGSILGTAGQLGLDSLSLQSRAAELMLQIDKVRARRMFADIPKPAIAALTCDDDVMPRLDEYYRRLGRMAQETFTVQERQREEPVNFLVDYVAGVSSPSQLLPVLSMLRGLKLPADQMQLLYAKFGSAIESMQPDDRSFGDVTGALTPLLNAELMPAFQRFIANHASAPRCQRAAPANLQVSIAGAPAPSPEQQRDMLWHTPEAKQIAQMGFDLRIQNSRVLTVEDRREAAWQLKYAGYMDALARWQRGDGESEAAFFHEKVTAYMIAADLAVTPDARSYAVSEAVRTIASSSLEQSSPAEWFLRLTQADPGSSLKAEILAACESSGNPVLVLYAELNATK